MKRDKKIMDEIVEQAGKCELCGSKRGLEAHHIIPVCVGGDNTEENLICLCQNCHARLTPRSKLCKIGLDRYIGKIKIAEVIMNVHNHFYSKCLERSEGIEEIFDAFDETIDEEIARTDTDSFIKFAPYVEKGALQ